MAYLGKKGYTIFKSEYSSKELNQIRNEMNVKPYSPHSTAVIEYPIYRESTTKIYLPRYYGLHKLGEFTNKLSKGEEINIDFKGELFDYQKTIIQKYIDHVGESGGGLLDVEPGKGKTVMALKVISQLKRKTIVIVHKTFLMNQWMERIETFLPTAKIGRIQGDTIDIEGKDIVLGMLQSLSNKKYPSELWDQFGLCVFDECHHLSAEVFSEVMREIVTNYNLGLSGTMKRKDGLSKVFEYYIGPVVHKEKTDITTEVLIKSVYYHNDTLFDDVKTDYRGQPLYSTMINKLNFPSRIQLIIDILKYELQENPNQQIMILSNTKQIIEDLHDNMKDLTQTIGYYVGGMKEEALKESEKKDIILATYSMASEGLDIKTLTTLIMATPKSDVCQSIGRILRSKHSKPLVIDVVDPHTVFKNQYKKRCVYYKSKNFKIQQFKSKEDYFKQIQKVKTETKCLVTI